jgi:hypothetical protein
VGAAKLPSPSSHIRNGKRAFQIASGSVFFQLPKREDKNTRRMLGRKPALSRMEAMAIQPNQDGIDRRQGVPGIAYERQEAQRIP